jgi:hypothetical protein
MNQLPIPEQTAAELARLQQRMLLAGGILSPVCAAMSIFTPRQFIESYLIGFLFVLGIALGSLAMAMVHQLSGGAWGVMVRRSLGAASRTLPVVTLLFLPILVGMRYLYPWTDSTLVAHDPLLQWKRPYLNVPFFYARAIFYFAVWNSLSFFLNRWSLEQDATGDPAIAQRMRSLSAGGLVAYGVTVSFASFDWLMSIEPHWYSTMFGVLVLGAQGLSALAFAVVALDWLSRRAPLSAVVRPAHFHDLGNLVLAFVMLWAYFAFSQYLIIWSGNLPEEIDWYAHRLARPWRAIGVTIVALHFAVPFLLLLSRRLKRDSRLLAGVAAWLLLLRLVDLIWTVEPAFPPGPRLAHALDILVPSALVTVWLAAYLRQLGSRPLLPVHDPEFAEVVANVVDLSHRTSPS